MALLISPPPHQTTRIHFFRLRSIISKRSHGLKVVKKIAFPFLICSVISLSGFFLERKKRRLNITRHDTYAVSFRKICHLKSSWGAPDRGKGEVEWWDVEGGKKMTVKSSVDPSSRWTQSPLEFKKSLPPHGWIWSGAVLSSFFFQFL